MHVIRGMAKFAIVAFPVIRAYVESEAGALVQQKSLMKIQAPEKALQKDRPSMAQTTVTETKTSVQSLLSQVQGVHVKKADAISIRVNFTHEGKLYEYDVFAHNVYSKNAMVLIGSETASPTSVNTYTARAKGSWATMTWHDDGSVNGLFEDSGRLMEVKPVAHLDDHTATMLRQSYKGDEVPHVIRWMALPQLGSKHVHLGSKHVGRLHDPSLGHDGGEEVPEDVSDPGPIEYEAAPWAGVPWFPGCYAEDDKLHEMIVSIASDASVYNYKGKNADAIKADLETIVAEASFVYEKQLNIKLSIGNLEVATTEDKFGGCPASDEMGYKLGKLQDAVKQGTFPALAAAHLFSACGSQWGSVGLAYCGSMCWGEWATGATKFHTGSPWLTYAHELGHNINADHSFEDGQGKTGGIMDYGDGKLDGHYQFNTKYRKQEVCDFLDQSTREPDCDGNFGLAPEGSSSPAHEAGPSPTPSPTPPLEFTIVSGPCEMQSGGCVSSPNYPGEYGNSAHCTIRPSSKAGIHVDAFATESGYDFLIVDGVRFDGNAGPDGVDVKGEIVWTSDSSVATTGWKICPQ